MLMAAPCCLDWKEGTLNEQTDSQGFPPGVDPATLVWHRPTLISDPWTSDNCVEVAAAEGLIFVRNSRYPDGAVLSFTQGEWDAFAGGVALGQLTYEKVMAAANS